MTSRTYDGAAKPPVSFGESESNLGSQSDLHGVAELQKKEVKPLKSLGRAQNRRPREKGLGGQRFDIKPVGSLSTDIANISSALALCRPSNGPACLLGRFLLPCRP
jgi:hypothetical protein